MQSKESMVVRNAHNSVSGEEVGRLVSAAKEDAQSALIQAAWEQWRSLGAFAAPAGMRPAEAIIDPEALVLVSLALRAEERRLDGFLWWLADVGGDFLSVQRMLNLSRLFPENVRAELPAFAEAAARAGRKQWQRHVGGSSGINESIKPRAGTGHDRLLVTEAPALMLRLRAGFGVGAKADVLSFLMGTEGRFASIATIAAAANYTDAAVRKAANEMAVAQFIEESKTAPAAYRANMQIWSSLLRGAHAELAAGGPNTPPPPPPWRYWDRMFAFLAGVLVWAEEGLRSERSAYLLSSRARDLYETHHLAFAGNHIAVPEPENYRGSTYLAAFASSIAAVRRWTAEHV